MVEALAATSRAHERTFGSSSPNASPPTHILKSPQVHLTPPWCCISAAHSASGRSPAETGQPPNISNYSEDRWSSPSPPCFLCIGEKRFFFSCGVGAPILRISANDGIVSPDLPSKRSNLSSCSDQSSRERQDGRNNICSKEVNSSL